MKKLLSREPVMIAAFLETLLLAGVAFGLPLSGQQVAAIVGVATAGLALAAAARAVVTPVHRVERVIEAAAKQVGVEVAAELTDGSAGAVGQITPKAQEVISGAVRNVGGIVRGAGRMAGLER